eukprot:jgi/Tetstr1/455520/TSEL_042344.t1
MHNGDTFASMSSESATSSNHGTENQGSPEFTEQLKLYKHHVPISPRAIYTFLRHTGRDDAPATGPAIIDKKRALRIRQLKTTKKLRRAPLPCDIIADILDNLAVFPTTTTDYGNILRHGVAVCPTFTFYSRSPVVSLSSQTCRLRDMDVDAHNITLLVNREK